MICFHRFNGGRIDWWPPPTHHITGQRIVGKDTSDGSILHQPHRYAVCLTDLVKEAVRVFPSGIWKREMLLANNRQQTRHLPPGWWLSARHVWIMPIDLLYHGKFRRQSLQPVLKNTMKRNLPSNFSWVTTLPSSHGDAECRQLVSCNQLYTSCMNHHRPKYKKPCHTTVQRYKEYTIYQLFIDFLFCKDKRFFMKSLLLHHETRIERKYRTPFYYGYLCYHCWYLRLPIYIITSLTESHQSWFESVQLCQPDCHDYPNRLCTRIIIHHTISDLYANQENTQLFSSISILVVALLTIATALNIYIILLASSTDHWYMLRGCSDFVPIAAQFSHSPGNQRKNPWEMIISGHADRNSSFMRRAALAAGDIWVGDSFSMS